MSKHNCYLIIWCKLDIGYISEEDFFKPCEWHQEPSCEVSFKSVLKNSSLQNCSAGKGLSTFQGQEKDFSASFFGIWFFVFQLFLSGPSGFSPKSRNFRHDWTFSNPFIHSYPLILKLHTSSSVPRSVFKNLIKTQSLANLKFFA